jgi:hypothetical protein
MEEPSRISPYQDPNPGTASPGAQPGVLHFDIDYPERLSRGLIFIKWLLIVPHLVVLYFLGIAVSIVTFIAWFAILFTGSYPRGLWDFTLMVHHWQMNVSAYFLLMRDEYPPFAAGPYPVRYDIAYPERLSRGLIFIKWLLIIPHAIVVGLLGLVAYVVLWIAWFAILFTGQYPRSLFDFMVGFFRWTARMNLYASLMTDVYPPFTLE